MKEQRARLEAPVASEALAVNLRRTSVQVEVPEEHLELLELLEGRYGLQRDTENLLREIHHPYPGWEATLRDLQQRALNDFSVYNAHPRGARAIEIYQELFRHLVLARLPDPFRARGLTLWIRYQEKILRASGQALPRNAPELRVGMTGIAQALRQFPAQAPAAGAYLRRMARALLETSDDLPEPVIAAAVDLLADALEATWRFWLAEPDPRAWAEEMLARAGGDDADLLAASASETLAAISHEEIERLRDATARLRAAGTPAADRLEALAAFPDHRRWCERYLEVARALGRSGESGRRMQVCWMCRMITREALAPVREAALRETRTVALRALRDASTNRRLELIREIFASLPARPTASMWELVVAVGTDVLRADDAAAIDALIEAVLQLEFQPPEFRGFGDDWTVRVNPAHLANVRALLRLIEANPARARRLAAALVVQLSTHGLYVADTDLFQRDVSALLAAEIGPIYDVVKALVRLFPVYFDEIGAEGELRDVSTRIDEIEGRRDPLCHFLRKQCHVECNPQLIPLVAAVAEHWASGSPEPLRPFLPEAVLANVERRLGALAPVRELASRWSGNGTFLQASDEQLEALLQDADDPVAADKIRLLARLYALLLEKYSLEPEELVPRLRHFGRVSESTLARLQRQLARGDDAGALEAALDVLEQLRALVLDRAPSEAVEDIYRKRHIAVGIPSMYGRYQERRFDAMGLMLRTESLVTRLLDRLVERREVAFPTRSTLRQVHRWLCAIVRALRLEGFEAKGLSMGTSMLEQALTSPDFSVDQFLDVFRFLSRAINYLIRVRFIETYEPVMARLVSGDGDDQEELALRRGEVLMRELIDRSVGIRQADRLVGHVLRALDGLRERFEEKERSLLLSYEPERAVSRLYGEPVPREGRFLLGYKGETLKELARRGIPTPPGFIVTTETFRCRGFIARHPMLLHDLRDKIRRGVREIERATGTRLGDRRRPLVLSVRSGSAMSMPGMMDTFLNVGLTEHTVEGLGEMVGSRWAAWDAFRRLLQSWGMSHGIERDRFDREIQAAKEAGAVDKKAQLDADRMRALALAYREILREHGVDLPDDPFEQLAQAIDRVQCSWNSEKARVYRRAMQIAEEWGTAVIVQRMVFGNLGPRSGTGVVFTREPHRATAGVRLFGDYAVQSQGEDVVAGLVETHPISSMQSNAAEDALEVAFPEIYAQLLEWSRALVERGDLQHQEIEFTFESPRAADLWVLQSRDMVFFAAHAVPAFVPTEQLARAKVARGIGVGGGALSGRIAFTAEDVTELRRRHPGEPILLLRPDTVPEDIPLILECEGLLTTLGGATCHAAVAAQALGKTCVVGCGELEVDEGRKLLLVAGRRLRAGDVVSINGRDGSVYLGRHEVTTARQRGLTA